MPPSLQLAAAEFSSRSSQSLIGNHPAIAKLRTLVERVAPTHATVLITGESGTGKEVVARMIHAASPRRGPRRAFVPVNCAAIPGDLLESEMFGHERGAFTSAAAPRQGLFSAAEGGTIFLDEDKRARTPVAGQAAARARRPAWCGRSAPIAPPKSTRA